MHKTLQQVREHHLFALCLMIAIANALLPWIITGVMRPSEPLSVSIIYRNVRGDIQYYPMISHLAQGDYREFCVWEQRGRNWHFFPVASLLLHAICIFLFGNWGFICADVLVTIIFYWLLYYFWRLFHIGKTLSAISSLLLVLQIPFILGILVGPIAFEIAPVWGQRLPRPFVCELFLLLVLIAVSAILRKNSADGKWWCVLGAGMAALIQSDIHSAFVMATSIPVCIWLVASGTDKSSLWRNTLLAALSGAICVLPLVLQRLQHLPDVATRCGLFAAARLAPLYSGAEIAKCLVPLAFFALCYWANLQYRRLHKPLLYFCVLAVIVHLAVPLSIIVTGHGIQLYQFRDRASRIMTYCVLVCILWGLDCLSRRVLKHYRLGEELQRRLQLAVVLSLLIFASCYFWLSYPGISQLYSGHMRPKFYPQFRREYRTAFAEVTRVLAEKNKDRKQVLATFDHQLLAWWLTFTNGYSFLAEPFMSTVTDQEIEKRVAILCRELGMSPRDYLQFLNLPYVANFWLGLAKYQASAAYTFASLHDYPQHVRQQIRRTSIYDNWHLAIPNSEQQRLLTLFHRVSPSHNLRWHLLVVRNDKKWAHLTPATKRWKLVYHNKVFRVYQRQ